MTDLRSAAELALAEALASGDDLEATLRALATELPVAAIADRVAAGDSLYAALGREGQAAVRPGFGALVTAAERHPPLAARLPELVQIRCRLRARSSELWTSLAGPAATLCATFAAAVIAAELMLPRFEPWFAELGVAAPRFVGVVRTLFSWPLLLALVVVVATVAAAARRGIFGGLLLRTGRPRAVLAPGRAAALAALAAGLEAGLGPAEAAELAADIVRGGPVTPPLAGAGPALRGGSTLVELLERDRLVPRPLLTSVRAARGTTLPSAVRGLADFYRVEADAGAYWAKIWIGAAATAAAGLVCVAIVVGLALAYGAILEGGFAV